MITGAAWTPYQIWLLAAMVFFCLGPLGISLWLASSVLSIVRKKRLRLLLGALVLAGLLLSGWVTGLNHLRRIGEMPNAPVTPGELVLLGYLHTGAIIGVGIVLFGRRRAPRSRSPNREEDLGMGQKLLSLHAARNPRNPLLRIPFNQNYQVRQRDWELPLELDDGPLPADLHGFTILHLSDLHLGSHFIPEYYDSLRERVQATERDVLILTGDFLHTRCEMDHLGRFLQGLGDPERTFAILGNHDIFDHDRREVESVISRSGVRLLGGKTALIRRGSAAVGFAGLDYQNWWLPFPVEELRRQIPAGALPVLITHTPCVFPRAMKAGFPLVLCGHTHGGQVRFPGIGALFIPGRYGRRYQMGLYQVGSRYLHVHPGLGGPIPLRIGCTPELTRLILGP